MIHGIIHLQITFLTQCWRLNLTPIISLAALTQVLLHGRDKSRLHEVLLSSDYPALIVLALAVVALLPWLLFCDSSYSRLDRRTLVSIIVAGVLSLNLGMIQIVEGQQKDGIKCLC